MTNRGDRIPTCDIVIPKNYIWKKSTRSFVITIILNYLKIIFSIWLGRFDRNLTAIWPHIAAVMIKQYLTSDAINDRDDRIRTYDLVLQKHPVSNLRQSPQETSEAIAYELALLRFSWVSISQSHVAGYSKDERIFAK